MIPTVNALPVSQPLFTSAFANNVVPVLGTGFNQRIGSKIKVKRLVIDMMFEIDYTRITNFAY